MKKVYRYDSFKKDRGSPVSRAAGWISRNRRRIIIVLSALVALLFVLSCVMTALEARVDSATAETTRTVEVPRGQVPAPPSVAAAAAVLMDEQSGRVLYEKNAHTALPMASTTKMMTALVVREQLDLEDEIVISPQAAEVGEQEIWLEPGEVMTAEQLLWALLVQSANDAAYALAEYTVGSVESFAGLMNKKAQQIGANESSFTNPHGLDQQGHYSTAYDLAVIGRELLQDDVLKEMVGAKCHELPWPGRPHSRVCQSHNEILEQYEGATGIKTGYTEDAGRCLVASAEREGKSLVAVVLNSEYRADDATRLLDYGFNSTELVVLASPEDRLGRTRVSSFPRKYVYAVPEREMTALSLEGSGDRFEVTASIAREKGSGVEEGDRIGEITCRIGGNTVCREDAVAESTVNGGGPLAGALAFLWYALCWMGRIIAAPFTSW